MQTNLVQTKQMPPRRDLEGDRQTACFETGHAGCAQDPAADPVRIVARIPSIASLPQRAPIVSSARVGGAPPSTARTQNAVESHCQNKTHPINQTTNVKTRRFTQQMDICIQRGRVVQRLSLRSGFKQPVKMETKVTNRKKQGNVLLELMQTLNLVVTQYHAAAAQRPCQTKKIKFKKTFNGKDPYLAAT